MVEKVTGMFRENTWWRRKLECPERTHGGEGNWNVRREHMVEKVTGMSGENTWCRR
jgi:hypothetical protein